MQIQFYGTLRGASGVHRVDVSLSGEATVNQVLALAARQEPRIGPVLLDGTGQLRHDLFILRNGRNIHLLQGVATRLTPLDRLDLFPLSGAQRAFAKD